MKKKTSAILIGAEQLEDGYELPDRHLVFCIAPEALAALVSVYDLVRPTDTEIRTTLGKLPISWNGKKFEVDCWIWDVSSRKWCEGNLHHAHEIGSNHHFFDGETIVYLSSDIPSLTSEEAQVVSCALSLRTISTLIKSAKSNRQFVMATVFGIAHFEEFESFEYHFQNAISDPHEHVPGYSTLLTHRSWI